jgi:transcriptional regulator
MYVPAAFQAGDEGEAEAFLAEHSFATIVSPSPSGMLATHVPVTVRRGPAGLVLVGHLARANRHWEQMTGTAEALAIVLGPAGYVSPTWYASGPAVPTWNYGAVHAHGRPRAVDEPEFARAALAELVARHEAGPGGWRMEAQPPGFVDRLVGAIVAFEMPVDRLETVLKLGQNRPDADRAGVIAGLERAGTPAAAALAALMRAAAR